MADEGFLRRWARRKIESRLAEAPPEDHEAHVPAVQTAAPPGDAPAAPADAPARPLPGMDDVARLTPDADFSAFVARGVDPAVRRGALKKLFADPHFHAMDGLDVYIDDYTKPSPVSAAMLASLTHAKRVLQPLFDEQAGEQESAQAERPPANDAQALRAADAVDSGAEPAPDDAIPSEQPTQSPQATQETQ